MSMLYVLELRGGKYYVGKTDDVQQRVCEHFAGSGCAWTRLHHPLRLVRTLTNTGPLGEDTLVKETMLRYGIDSVRGGSYSNEELTEAQYSVLERELRGARNACFRCGKVGHMATSCLLVDDDDESDEDDEADCCFRCGHPGHWASECYAKYDVDGYAID